jgi:hypothetical protein
MQWRNFRGNPLFTLGNPSMEDVDQNALGDCWFLATLAGAARENPNIIAQSITDLGDGTFAVRFNNFFGGAETYVRVDADLPTNAAGAPIYAGLGRANATWVALMEKAFTWMRGGNPQQSQPIYGTIAGGHTYEAAVALGLTSYGSAKSFASANAMGQWISDQASNGRFMTLETSKTPASQMIGSHAYTIVGAYQANGTWQVIVRNPWKRDGGTGYSDANPNDGWLTLPAATLMASMTNVMSFK